MFERVIQFQFLFPKPKVALGCRLDMGSRGGEAVEDMGLDVRGMVSSRGKMEMWVDMVSRVHAILGSCHFVRAQLLGRLVFWRGGSLEMLQVRWKAAWVFKAFFGCLVRKLGD